MLLAAGCQQHPPAFVSKGDKFQAQFAGEPKVVEKTVGGRRSVVYSVVTTDGARTVAVTELPLKGDEPPELIPRYLDSAKDDMIRAVGGKLASETNTTLAGKYPGRDFSADVTEPNVGTLRARIYLVGARLYQVTVLGTDSYAASNESTAFLDSFQLTE
ncbi:hypothetical protein J8F10_25655 [Gemmata sp. G18]|uniref:Lipoprotein LpqN n=1 Tax=Gemmata palustris TaxID=2822762 RepID=A0ABS5BYZ5_9BACT|nr:hypothetical protein [Gemmata palustris]MBP3958647.1 hypothetical protein [Gemmata palustris]